MYWCSCNNRRKEYLLGLNTYIGNNFTEVNNTYPECYHIETVKHFACECIDGLHGISAEYDLKGAYQLYMSLQVNFTVYTLFTDHSYSAFDFPVSELNLEESSIVCHPLIDNAKDISLFLGISHL